MLLFTFLLLTLIPYAAPSPPFQIPRSRTPSTTDASTNAISLHRRTPIARVTTAGDILPLPKRGTRTHHVTIANGWSIHYKIFSLISPTIPALLDLRLFYSLILSKIEHRIASGDLPTTVSELSLGEYTLQIMAEKGFGMPLNWEVIVAFVEKLLESTVPVSFMCHIAPPGSDVGVSIRMWVGKHI